MCCVRVNVSYGVLLIKISFMMVLVRLKVDGISSSRRHSGKQFLISFSCKNGIKMNKPKQLIVKVNRYSMFRWFFNLLIWFVYILLLKQHLLKYQAIFFEKKMLYCKFCARRLNNFSSLLLKLLSNIRHSMLQYLRGKCFNLLPGNVLT